MGINSDILSSNGADKPDKIDVEALTKKYLEEKDKRQRVDGLTQNEELEESESFKLSSLADDPFVDHDALNAQQQPLEDGQQVQVIILGSGFGESFTNHQIVTGFLERHMLLNKDGTCMQFSLKTVTLSGRESLILAVVKTFISILVPALIARPMIIMQSLRQRMMKGVLMPSYSEHAVNLHVSKVNFLLYTVFPFVAPTPLLMRNCYLL